MYLDPGLGSLIIQFLIGLVVAIPVVAGIHWKRTRTILNKVKLIGITYWRRLKKKKNEKGS